MLLDEKVLETVQQVSYGQAALVAIKSALYAQHEYDKLAEFRQMELQYGLDIKISQACVDDYNEHLERKADTDVAAAEDVSYEE